MPRRRQDFLVARSKVNLDTAGGLSNLVAQRRDKFFTDFSAWTEEQLLATVCVCPVVRFRASSQHDPSRLRQVSFLLRVSEVHLFRNNQ